MESELVGVARSVKGREKPNCAQCVHYTLIPADSALLYSSPKHRCTAAIDFVTGKSVLTDCYTMRDPRCECGPDANLFQNASAKEKDESKLAASPAGSGIGRGFLLFILAILAILALVFWGYEQQTDPLRIIQTGEVSVRDAPCCVTARTRLVATGKRSFWQFEASPGEWKDCGDDCRKAARKALAK